MAICNANMKDCDRKKKCLNGPNEGKAYNPKDPCCGVGTFNPLTCDCDTGCTRIWTRVLFGDGMIATGVNAGLICSSEWCDDNYVLWLGSPLQGFNPFNLGIEFFYSPTSCGIAPRGALTNYAFTTDCDGQEAGEERSYATVVPNSVDFQPLAADIYIAPHPFPLDCDFPNGREGLVSEGVAVAPPCFTHISSAINTASDRIVCPL